MIEAIPQTEKSAMKFENISKSPKKVVSPTTSLLKLANVPEAKNAGKNGTINIIPKPSSTEAKKLSRKTKNI